MSLVRGKKELLAKVLFGSGTLVERVLGSRPSDRLLVLAYHRICDLPAEGYPFQHETVSATPEQFDRQLDFIKRRFEVVNFHRLAEMEKSGDPLPPNLLVITFDDGYEDNYTVALPILKAHGLTATVYVSTGFIDSGQPFWFEMLSYYVMRMKPGVIRLRESELHLELTDANRHEVRRVIGRGMRVVADRTRLAMLEELKQQAGVAPSDDELALVRPLSWQQVRTLDAAGVEIGSHTVTHPFLVQLDDEELAAELGGSKARIEEETGRKVSSLAYPTGGSEFFDERAVRLAGEFGYRYAVSYDHATVRADSLKRFEIPRIHVEPEVSDPLFKANLMLPRVFVR